MNRKLILLLISLLFITSPLVSAGDNNQLQFIKVPVGQETVTEPVQVIEMKVNVIFKVDGNFQWSQPKGWFYVQKFIEGERRSTYQVEMSDLHLLNPNELAVTFDIRMRVAPPTESAPFNPDWNEDMDLPPDLKKLAKAFASTSETYFDYTYKVYDFVSHYIEYDESWLEKDPKDINELWQNKRGVCRHYVMLMKAFLDYAGIESLYSLGFLVFTNNGQQVVGVHMWIYVYDPENGWVMFDPTNNIYGQFTERGYTYTYTMNFPVKITDDYVPYIYLPIYGVDQSKVKELYNVLNYKGVGEVTIQNLVLEDENIRTYFIRTVGAGNIYYVPLSYYERNEDIVEIMGKYNYQVVPEYVPEEYVVPIGSSITNIESFYEALSIKADEVDFNKYFTLQYDAINNNLIVHDNLDSGLKLYLTNQNGRLLNPIVGDKIYKYKLDDVGKLDKMDLYLNIFGQLNIIKSFKINVDSLQATPIITIPTINGYKSVIEVQTTPDLGEKLKNYLIITEGSIEEWYDDHTIIVSSNQDYVTLTLGTKSTEVDLYDTGIQITSSSIEFKKGNTILHLQYNKNVGELLVKYSLTPLYMRIGEKEYPITYKVEKNKIDMTASLTLEVFMNPDYNYYFITRMKSKDILNIDFTYTVEDLTANYDGSTITITGWVRIKPKGFKFDENSFKEFSIMNIEDFKTIGTVYKVKFSSDPIPTSEFTNPYKFTINVFGKDIKIVYRFTVTKPVIKMAKLLKYNADPDKTTIYYALYLTYSSANANEYMVNYMYSNLLNYVRINNYKYTAKYSPKPDYLIGVTKIPTQALLKMQALSIFGVKVQQGVDYELDKKYIEPKIIFKTLPLIGNMECNVPYYVDVKEGHFEIIFSIKSVYTPIQCSMGSDSIVLKPEVPYVFTVNIIDTSRINDVKDSSTIYAGYDGVYLGITTTAVNMNFRILLDNKTINNLEGGSIKIPLPKLNEGTHTLSIYDSNNIEVYRKTITIEPQPLSHKLMHNFLLIIIFMILIILIVVVKYMGQEDPIVKQAKTLFPNTEFLQKEQYGDWTYIYLMDDLKGEIITVMFYQGRIANVTRNKLF